MTTTPHTRPRPARPARRLAWDELPALVVAVLGFAGLAVGSVPWLLVMLNGGLPGLYLGMAGLLASTLTVLAAVSRLAGGRR